MTRVRFRFDSKWLMGPLTARPIDRLQAHNRRVDQTVMDVMPWPPLGSTYSPLFARADRVAQTIRGEVFGWCGGSVFFGADILKAVISVSLSGFKRRRRVVSSWIIVYKVNRSYISADS